MSIYRAHRICRATASPCHMPQPFHHSPICECLDRVWLPLRLPNLRQPTSDGTLVVGLSKKFQQGHVFHHATGTAYSFVQIWVVAVDLVLALRCSFCHGWRWSAAMAGTLCRRVAEPFRESLGGIGIALPQQRNWHPHRHSISLPENCHWIWGGLWTPVTHL